MDKFAQAEQEFSLLERGEPRLHRIREVMTEADEQRNLFWQFRLRYDYLEESIFCGDRYFAMIIFPEMLKLYENHQELQENTDISHDMLICFRWIVEAAPEFPQITRTEIDSYFHLFKRMLLEQGKSLSIYYMKHGLFYMHVDKAIAAADFYRFLEAPLDDISDGIALYHHHQTSYYLSIDEEEKALHAAEPIFSGKFRSRSDSLPQVTYHNFICYYMRKEQYAQAMHYARLTEKRILHNPYYLDIIGPLMSLYSITSPAEGMHLFNTHEELYHKSRNPLLKMLFSIGAYHLFRTAEHSKETEERRRYFYQTAESAVRKFDSRNGTEDFSRMLHMFDKQFTETEGAEADYV